MAIGVNALAFAIVAQVLAVAGMVMVLVWCIPFLGGLAWESSNKSLIFNIHPALMLIGLVIIGGEARLVEPDISEPADENYKPKGSVDRDMVLARVETEKWVSLIKAWEDSKKSKVENKAQKKLSAIVAWENSEKAYLEAKRKMVEEKLEMQNAEYVKKMNKLALMHINPPRRNERSWQQRKDDRLEAELAAIPCQGDRPQEAAWHFLIE